MSDYNLNQKNPGYSAKGSAANSNEVTVPQRGVPFLVQQISDRTKDLTLNLAGLRNTLTPVLTEPHLNKDERKPTEPATGSSPLARDLTTILASIISFNEEINYLIDRVEV